MKSRIMTPQPKFSEVLEQMHYDTAFYGWYLETENDTPYMELDGHTPPDDIPGSHPVKIGDTWYWHE